MLHLNECFLELFVLLHGIDVLYIISLYNKETIYFSIKIYITPAPPTQNIFPCLPASNSMVRNAVVKMVRKYILTTVS